MPQPSPPNQQPDARAEVILGIDTHKDVHAAVVISLLGVVLGRRCFSTTASGYQSLLDWARGFGALRRAGVECTGSYGKALTRYLRAATGDIAVIEVNKPDRATRRRRGKTDTIDAEAAARAVLSGQASATAKTSDGNVEMLRLFKLAKSSAIKSRTQTINQLKSVLIGADPGLRDEFAALSTNALVRRCASLTVPATTELDGATRYTLRLLAQRVQALSAEITELEDKLATPSTAMCPNCCSRSGSAQTAPPSCSSPPVTTPIGWPTRPPSPRCAAPARSRPHRARPAGGGSTAAATATPTQRST